MIYIIYFFALIGFSVTAFLGYWAFWDWKNSDEVNPFEDEWDLSCSEEDWGGQ